MKIKDIYNLAIELGIKNDLRPKEHIKNLLKRAKDKYEKARKARDALAHKGDRSFHAREV